MLRDHPVDLVFGDLVDLPDVSYGNSVTCEHARALHIDRDRFVDAIGERGFGHQRIPRDLLGHQIGGETESPRFGGLQTRVFGNHIEIEEEAIGGQCAELMQLHGGID